MLLTLAASVVLIFVLLLFLHIHTLNYNYLCGSNKVIEKANFSILQKIIVDAGCSGEKFAFETKKVINDTMQVIKGNEKHAFIVLIKRWIVEQRFTFLKNGEDYEKIVKEN